MTYLPLADPPEPLAPCGSDALLFYVWNLCHLGCTAYVVGVAAALRDVVQDWFGGQEIYWWHTVKLWYNACCDATDWHDQPLNWRRMRWGLDTLLGIRTRWPAHRAPMAVGVCAVLGCGRVCATDYCSQPGHAGGPEGSIPDDCACYTSPYRGFVTVPDKPRYARDAADVLKKKYKIQM